MAKEKKEFTEAEKKRFKAQKEAEFNQLVQQAKRTNPDPVSRAVAQQELRKRNARTDRYLRKNEPARYAEKLREKAAYYDEKAKSNK